MTQSMARDLIPFSTFKSLKWYFRLLLEFLNEKALSVWCLCSYLEQVASRNRVSAATRMNTPRKNQKVYGYWN